MRIAQVSPLVESVPPKTYGGIERVVHNLTETLVERGHDVTLFATGDSQTSADLVAVVDEPLRTSAVPRDVANCHLRQLMEVIRMVDRFDIVHFHTDHSHFPVWRYISTPQVLTMHGRLDLPDLPLVFAEFPDMAVISISDAQRRPLPQAHWAATVYNGTLAANYIFQPRGGEYFAFVGRFSPDKGPVDAIEIAKRSGVPLKMAAKLDRDNEAFFREAIEPHLTDPLIEYVGEVDEAGKNVLLGGARALLFPIHWPEPFGLVMTEAMACGTPVIAFRDGSVDEVMRDGVTGFIVESIDEAVAAAGKLDQIERQKCRDHFEANFSVSRMTDGYLQAYTQIIHSRRSQDAAAADFSDSVREETL